MSSLILNANKIFAEASTAVGQTKDLHGLEVIKSSYLGKNGKLTSMLRQLVDVDVAERPRVGQEINRIKEELLKLVNTQSELLKSAEVEASLQRDALDITMPPCGQGIGSSHPITKIRRILEEFFVAHGFVVVEGPEIENEFYNFSALNIPEHHPARAAHDTFYFAGGDMLRSQTSPVQIRAMQQMELPLRIVCPGKVFRRDNDSTHSPMFHQLEMLMIDEKLNFSNLKWLINKFIQYFFKEKIEYRFRPSYFPFTEPSAEVDIKWQVGDSWRWLELGGCGVVHPNVLRAVNIDPERYRGLAFGFGIDRLAMSYYGIEDIRMLFENDLQFLQQF